MKGRRDQLLQIWLYWGMRNSCLKSQDGKNVWVAFEIRELKRFSIVCGLFGSIFLKNLNRITLAVKTLILQLLIIAYYVNIYIYIYIHILHIYIIYIYIYIYIYKTVLFFLSWRHIYMYIYIYIFSLPRITCWKKVSNRNTRPMSEICSKLTTKSPKGR